jgi:hypothetical protein
LTDRLHPPERAEQFSQRVAGDPEDLHVDVFRSGWHGPGAVSREPGGEYSVPHPAADDERAAAGIADAGGDRCDESGRCSTVHDSIM